MKKKFCFLLISFLLLLSLCPLLWDSSYQKVPVTINQTLYHAAGDTSQTQVITGRDGFLFYGDTLDDFMGSNPMTTEEITDTAALLAQLSDAFSARGTQFLFLCAPNKNTVYPDKMPYYAIQATEKTNRERLHEALNQTNTAYLDVLPLLQSQDTLTYYKTDTHWNPFGAMLVSENLLQHFSLDCPAYELTKTTSKRGDLSAMLFPASAATESVPAPDDTKNYSFVRPMRTMDDFKIQTRGGLNDKSVLVLRDSFGEGLFPYLAQAFGQMTYSRSYDNILSQGEGFDIVILETAERNLPLLLTYMN